MIIFLVLDFLILTFCGFVISNLLFKSSNKLLLAGASMILGPLGLLLVLSVFSYFLKGYTGIRIIFLFYILSCLLLFVKFLKKKINWKLLFKFNLHTSNFVVLIILLVYASFLFFNASTADVGADADIYWGIAASFTRGNYPTVLPWQSNFLTVYHEGAFIVEGALRALAPVGIATIHNFFTAFILLAILLFVTGVARERIRSVICLLPGVLGIFLFGGPVFPVSIDKLIPGFWENLILYPGYENFRGGNGSGANSFAGLMYSNFYTFGLANFLIFIYIFYIQSRQKYNFFLFLILFLLSILAASIDETFFLIQIMLTFALLAYQIKDIFFKKFLDLFILLVITIISLFVIQNPVRDSLLTSSPELPRFKLLIESDASFLQKITYKGIALANFVYKKGEQVQWNGKNVGGTASMLSAGNQKHLGWKSLSVGGIEWVIIDFKVIVAAVLLLSLIIGSRLGILFTISAVICAVFATFVVNTFWIPNNARFVNQASELLMFGIGFLLIDLTVSKKRKIFYLVVVLFLIALIPQFLISHSKFIRDSFKGNHSYFTVNSIDSRLAEVEGIVPPFSKIVFLDAYPSDSPSTYLNSSASSRFGLFVPFSSFYPKVIGPEKGMEWFDAVNSLSPYAFKILNIDYVYVENTSLKRLGDTKIKQLNDGHLFKKIKGWDGAVLYKVLPSFKELTDDEMNIRKMISMIGRGSKVYLDRFSLSELRGIFLIQLSKSVHLTGSPFAHTNEFMYFETIIPFEDACRENYCDPSELKSITNLDYALMDSKNNPNLLFNDKFDRIASIGRVGLWKNVRLK